MRDEEFGRQGHAPVSGPARLPAGRPRADLVAPITVGRPVWERRYAHATLAVYTGALICLPGFYLTWQNVVRLPLVAAVLSVVALAVGGRGALRGWMLHLRRRGRATSSMLVVGADKDVAGLVAQTRSSPWLGWRIDGVCTSTGAGTDGATTFVGVPVVGDLDSVAALALAQGYDAVAVAPTSGWTPIRLQRLAGDLDGSRTALLVDPRLLRRVDRDVRVDGVDGLPLLRVTHRAASRPRRLAQEAVDRAGALLVVALVAPLLVGCALAVRRDGGPALDRRACQGRGGREFSLLTFRTTTGSGMSTPVGRVLQRHGVNQLPQLFNVLGGSMAFVGPRPPAPGEDVDGHATRRRVKPGIMRPREGPD